VLQIIQQRLWRRPGEMSTFETNLPNHELLLTYPNTRLLVSRTISIKYNVSPEVIDALRVQILLWHDNLPGIYLNIYPAAPPNKPLATLRLSGREEKLVSQAKAGIERLLAGTVVTDGEAALWDPWFRSHDAVVYLKDLCEQNSVHIQIDTCKSTLVLYGGTFEARLTISHTLMRKVEFLRNSRHEVVLDKGLLSKTFRGGMQKVRERFGNAATFNLSTSPRTITIHGSKDDLQVAQKLLEDTSDDVEDSPKEDGCSICWCPAEVPLVTSCGHTYCRECFYNAADSSMKSIPFVCHGKQGKCGHGKLKSQFHLLEINTNARLSMDSHDPKCCWLPTLSRVR
jgi:hypothetical protein